MKIESRQYIRKFEITVLTVLLCLTLSACNTKMSTSDIAAWAQELFLEELTKTLDEYETTMDDVGIDITEDMILVHKSGNEYSGAMVITMESDDTNYQLDFEVLCDGESIQYSITDDEGWFTDLDNFYLYEY